LKFIISQLFVTYYCKIHSANKDQLKCTHYTELLKITHINLRYVNVK